MRGPTPFFGMNSFPGPLIRVSHDERAEWNVSSDSLLLLSHHHE
jgi:hypothetical protein